MLFRILAFLNLLAEALGGGLLMGGGHLEGLPTYQNPVLLQLQALHLALTQLKVS